MKITIRDITKRYGAFTALQNVSLEVPQGKLVALLGPSGSGKTTLLRVIAGLEAPDSGSVLYEQDDVTQRAAKERNVGFVFQHYALFGHMTIFENIAFGLRVRKWKNDAVRERVTELLRLIQLEGLEKRLPSQLSGGQRQRVALARALAASPQMLLLDEPFGALDAKVRADLRRWIRQLHDEIHMTSVFVTHDQEEAFEVADHVVVMNKGRIEQEGAPDEVFAHPANAFVTDFLGHVNVFHGRIQNGRAHIGTVEMPMSFDVPAPEDHAEEGAEVTAYIRPHEVDIDRVSHGSDSMFAIVTRVNRSGSTVKIALVAQEGQLPLDVELPHERDAELGLVVNDRVWVYPRQVRVFRREEAALDKETAA
ncbi:MAG: sulfate/molybdate ABC transporter ATP-binding protein [Armatimonadetes bacterium]|nr:sulfate/molybdate ABC transporter ATP-binding protein [Armatimonadota bacterium]